MHITGILFTNFVIFRVLCTLPSRTHVAMCTKNKIDSNTVRTCIDELYPTEAILQRNKVCCIEVITV